MAIILDIIEISYSMSFRTTGPSKFIFFIFFYTTENFIDVLTDNHESEKMPNKCKQQSLLEIHSKIMHCLCSSRLAKLGLGLLCSLHYACRCSELGYRGRKISLD